MAHKLLIMVNTTFYQMEGIMGRFAPPISICGIMKDDITTFFDLCHEHLDTNNDGTITREEYESSIKKIIHLTPESIAGQNGIHNYDFFERIEQINWLIDDIRERGMSGQIRGCGIWGNVSDYVETYVENNKSHIQALQDQLLAYYQEGRLVDYMIEADSVPYEFDPDVISSLRGLEARFADYYKERALRTFTEDDRDWLIQQIQTKSRFRLKKYLEKVFSKDPQLMAAMSKTPNLADLPLKDLISMYKISVITGFMQELNLTYRYGATMTDLIEEGEMDCNIYAAMVIHLHQYLKVQGIDRTGCIVETQNMPGHCCVRVTLPESNTFFFVENNNALFEVENYMRIDWIRYELEDPLPPWIVAAEAPNERAGALGDDGMLFESLKQYLVAITLKEDPHAQLPYALRGFRLSDKVAAMQNTPLPEWGGLTARSVISALLILKDYTTTPPMGELVRTLRSGITLKDEK